MFQILGSTHFDFMGKRGVALPFSLVLVLGAVVVLLVHGLNLGIEFTGGTEMQVKYADSPAVAEVRRELSDAGFGGAVVTTIGAAEDNEIYIRLASGDSAGEQDDPTVEVLNALRGLPPEGDGRVDLNIDDERTIAEFLAEGPDLSQARAGEIAAQILESRREGNIVSGYDELSVYDGMSPAMIGYVEENADVGPLALRSQSFIGPAVGRELIDKAVVAIFGSLIGMLIYIWIRFQLQWGLAAVAALAHDTLITLGLFSLFNQEMSLPVVAAFLTLVGYSVNDTVVVFDRIRENQAGARGASLIETVNLSINQTLSRTVITSGLTWIVVLGLFLFGGAALRPFSFVLTAGVLVGTYSSIFVAAPIVVAWQSFRDKKRQSADAASRSESTARRTKAKKVRTTKTG